MTSIIASTENKMMFW